MRPRPSPLLLCLLSLLFLSGCVIAPIPLVETKSLSAWRGVDHEGKKSQIMAQEKTWYLPILVSPEGSAKYRSDTSSYRYYFTSPEAVEYDPKWPKQAELPWLAVETNYGYWQALTLMEPTPYWMAIRNTDFEASVYRDPPMRTYEIAVFDRTALKHKLVIQTFTFPSPIDPGYWDGWHYDRRAHTIEYLSAQGRRRLDLLTGKEEAVIPAR